MVETPTVDVIVLPPVVMVERMSEVLITLAETLRDEATEVAADRPVAEPTAPVAVPLATMAEVAAEADETVGRLSVVALFLLLSLPYLRHSMRGRKR